MGEGVLTGHKKIKYQLMYGSCCFLSSCRAKKYGRNAWSEHWRRG